MTAPLLGQREQPHPTRRQGRTRFQGEPSGDAGAGAGTAAEAEFEGQGAGDDAGAAAGAGTGPARAFLSRG